jgi:hypothetical protein
VRKKKSQRNINKYIQQVSNLWNSSNSPDNDWSRDISNDSSDNRADNSTKFRTNYKPAKSTTTSDQTSTGSFTKSDFSANRVSRNQQHSDDVAPSVSQSFCSESLQTEEKIDQISSQNLDDLLKDINENEL